MFQPKDEITEMRTDDETAYRVWDSLTYKMDTRVGPNLAGMDHGWQLKIMSMAAAAVGSATRMDRMDRMDRIVARPGGGWHLQASDSIGAD
jgi:hypothetical protein